MFCIFAAVSEEAKNGKDIVLRQLADSEKKTSKVEAKEDVDGVRLLRQLADTADSARWWNWQHV